MNKIGFYLKVDRLLKDMAGIVEVAEKRFVLFGLPGSFTGLGY